eukprot:g7074.t1
MEDRMRLWRLFRVLRQFSSTLPISGAGGNADREGGNDLRSDDGDDADGSSEESDPDVANRDMIDLGYQNMCVDMRFPSVYKKYCLDACTMISGTAWEQSCILYALDSEWHSQCEEFYDCVFSCDVHGGYATEKQTIGDGAKLERVERWRRQQLVSKSQMSFLREGERCEAMKCRSYCARKLFAGCREVQFLRDCEVAKARPGYLTRQGSCDVDCNAASTPALSRGGVGGAAGLVRGLAVPVILLALSWRSQSHW